VDAPWIDMLKTVSASPFSRLPAYRGSRDHIVGVMRVKDLVHRFVAEGAPPDTASLLRPFATVPATVPGDRLVALLREKRAHQAAVADQAGTIVGFVTIQDVLAQFLSAGIKAS